MEFCKMNGAGNDFIIINNMNGEIPNSKWPEIAKTVCERHLSVGADGIMVEVHNNPSCAMCDGAQSLTPAQFADLNKRIQKVREAIL